ncbi:MAG: sensor histidine kinase [Chloroflexota bacterium]
MNPLHSFRSLKLRYKVGFAFFLPVTLVLLGLLGADYVRDARAVRDQIEQAASQLGQITLGNMRHAMLVNDSEMVSMMVRDVAAQETVEKVWIVDANGVIRQSSEEGEIGAKFNTNEAGCFECHQYQPEERPQTINLQADPDILRIAAPIQNAPECEACHSADLRHLGVLLIDASMTEAQTRLATDTLMELLLSFIVLAACTTLGFILVQRLVVRRVEVIHDALAKLDAGDTSARISQRWRVNDELTELADRFDRMAANFESLQVRREERDRVRALAIVEERERIARELHDGVAQFLGYLSAKMAAIQVALKNQNVEAAQKNLGQVEESVREQSIEVRSAVIGLKMSGSVEQGLVNSVREFVDQCNRLDDLPIELELGAGLESVRLKNEQALQLFRILQEAVSNVRRHSRATEAGIRLAHSDGRLELVVRDNGVGFDPFLAGLERRGHFGMQIMVERAHAIGAQIEIKSSPGQGTQVIVTLAV